MLPKLTSVLGNPGVSLTFGLAVLGLLALALMADRASADDHSHSLRFGGRTRTYQVHLPPQYDGKAALPVVLNLHGGGGNADVQRRQSQMDRTADKYGFIVVYPEGTAGLGRMYTWNAGSCCGYAQKWKIDDVGFIRALLDELPSQYRVDRNRIYATGMSNGAMMCYRLACELSDRITAICGVASSMGVDGPKPSRPVPIMQIHGLKDPNSLFEGGIGPNAISKIRHRPVREVIAWWAAVNNCQPDPVEIERQRDYITERYAPAEGEAGAPIVLSMLKEGGHTWPGGVDVTPRLGTGKLIASFDSNARMWEFFRQFSLDGSPPRTTLSD